MTQTVDGDRRRLLALLGGAPALAAVLAGCAAAPRPKTAPGGRSELDTDVKVRWRAVRGEQELLALHAAVAAAHPGLAGSLAPLAAHHEEHLAVLLDDGPLPFGARDRAPASAATPPASAATPPASAATPPAGDGPAPDVPGDPAEALAAVAAAERVAGDGRITDCLAATGPRLAAVLAAIAGCEAGHAAVLTGEAG